METTPLYNPYITPICFRGPGLAPGTWSSTKGASAQAERGSWFSPLRSIQVRVRSSDLTEDPVILASSRESFVS